MNIPSVTQKSPFPEHKLSQEFHNFHRVFHRGGQPYIRPFLYIFD